MKKCRLMSQIRPKTWKYIVIFFKTLIQLYLFCLFLQLLTNFFKEGTWLDGIRKDNDEREAEGGEGHFSAVFYADDGMVGASDPAWILDLTKAYDALDRSRCLGILEGYGVGRKLVVLSNYWRRGRRCIPPGCPGTWTCLKRRTL